MITELSETKLTNGRMVSDYITLECSENDEDLSISYSIVPDSGINVKYVDPKSARKEIDKVEQYENILISSTLSTVIIIFEQFLAKMYEKLILINPKSILKIKK